MTQSIWDDEGTTTSTKSIWDEDVSVPVVKPERNAFARVNDFMIDAGNAAAGVVKSGVDLVAPGGKVSTAIDSFIKEGESKQSDYKQAGRKQLAANMKSADGELGKAKAYLQHAADDPMEVAAQGLGNLGPFGLLGKLGFGAKALMGITAGVGAGEVRGNILDKIKSKSDDELTKASPEYAELRKTMSEDEAKQEIGTKLVRHLPELAAAAAAGAVGGKYGAEAIAAGTRVAKSRIGGAAASMVDEAAQGAVEQIATNVGVKRTDATQSIWDDVALNAVQEGLPGGVVGVAAHRGAHEAPAAVQPPAPAAVETPATPQQQGPTRSQGLVRNAFADVMGDEGVLAQNQQTQAGIALSLSQIRKLDGDQAFATAIEHLSGGDGALAERLFEASENPDLLAAGKQNLGVQFVELNDGIRNDAGIVEDATPEQASVDQVGEAVPAVNTSMDQVNPEAVAAVRQGLMAGMVVPVDTDMDLSGLEMAEVTGPDGAPVLIVSKDAAVVQQAVARSFEVGVPQMATELFTPVQGKAVVQQIDPATGEVQDEAVVSPDQVGPVVAGANSSTHVRPVASVLAERLPAAPAAAPVVAVAADQQPAPLTSRFFARKTEKTSTPAAIEPTEQTGKAAALVDGLNAQFELQGDAAIDPASITEVKPSRELVRFQKALRAAFGVNLVAVHAPTGLMRHNGQQFNAFNGIADGDNLFVNVNSNVPLSVLGHELAHILETKHPEAYEKLELVVLSRMRAPAARQLKAQLEQAASDEGKVSDIRRELVGEAVGEMAEDQSLWTELFGSIGREATVAKQLYQALLEVIAKLQRALTGAGYTQGIKDISTVKKAVQAAFKEWAAEYENKGENPDNLSSEESGMYADFLERAAEEPATEKTPEPAAVEDNTPVVETKPESKNDAAEATEQPVAAESAAAAEPAAGQRGAGGTASQVAVDSRPKQGLRGPSLEGLAAEVRVDGQLIRFGGFKPAQQAARKYAAKAGIKYDPPKKYVKVDQERAARIAAAFTEMQHNPADPEVKASYDAMIKETLAQWEAIKATGLKVEFITGDDPYRNPRNAILDVTRNNHLWVFPTSDGFGGTESKNVDITGNPLEAIVPGETISGRPVQVNDIFRIVHDYFGHIKEGVGFRADGEENAWRAHMAMYSPLARMAATTETRGQNSWVNFGPFAQQNKTANGVETQYAPQKIGLLPDWVVEDGRTDEPWVAPVVEQPKQVEKPVEPAEPEDIPEEAFVEEEEAPDAPISFARNPMKLESVQDVLDFAANPAHRYDLADALGRGAFAEAWMLAKQPAQRKKLLSQIGYNLIEAFADSKIRLSRWISSLPLADGLKQRLEGDLRRADTMRSHLEAEVKDTFTEPMMKAITAASKATKLSSDQVKKIAGTWMAARYVPEANAQLIAKDRTALAIATASGDASKIAAAQQDLNDRILSVNGAVGQAKTRGVAGGMNDAEAAQAVAGFEQQIPVALLEDIARPIYDMLAWKKARDLSSGKVTQATVNGWLNSPHYVPLTGDPRADRETTDVFSAGGQLNQDADHAMNGRKDSVPDDGIDAAFAATIKTINFAAMQDFKRTLNKAYSEAQAAGLDIGLTREPVTGIVRTGDDVVIYRDTARRQNGSEFTQAHAFRFKDQAIIEALKKDNVETVNGLLKVIASPTRWYARAVTQFMPFFAPINLVRDIWERSEVLRTRKILDAAGNVVDAKKVARASVAATLDPALWKASMMKAFRRGGMNPVRADLEEMIRLGGSSTTGDFLDRSAGDLEKTIRGDASKLGHLANNIMHGVTSDQNSGLLKKAAHGVGVVAYNDMFEVIPSLAIYRSLKAQGVTAKDAAAAVLDLMNFRKKGTKMPAVRALYVFAQPAATSGYNLAKYLSTRTGQKRFAAQALIATVLYGLLAGAWGDDEDEELGNKLDNMPNFVIERSIPLKVGDYVLKVPVGFGPPQLAWAAGGIANRWKSGRYNTTDALGELAKGWAKSGMPLPLSEMDLSKRPVDYILQSITPTIIRPLMNIYADQTAFGAPLTPAFKNKDQLKNEQVKRNTAPIYSEIAKEVYDMIGVDLYPDHIKAIADGYLVGPFREIMNYTVEDAAKQMRGEPGRMPVVASLIDHINDRAVLNQIYSRVREDMDKAHRQVKSLQAEGDPDGKITPEMLQLEKAYQQFAAAEKVLGAQRKAITKMPGLDDETRSEKVQAVEERADAAHRRLLVQMLRP